MQGHKLLRQQVKALDRRHPPHGEHRLFPVFKGDRGGIALEEVRHVHKPCVAVVTLHDLGGFFHKLGRQQAQHIEIPVAVAKAPEVFLLKIVVVVELADLQDLPGPVFGKRQIVLVPRGNDDALGHVADHFPHRSPLAGQDAQGPHALAPEGLHISSPQGRVPFVTVRHVAQQIAHAHPLIHRHHRPARHLVHAVKAHVIALGKEVCHADDGLLHTAGAEVQGDDVDLLFPRFGIDRRLVGKAADAADDLGVVFTQVVALLLRLLCRREGLDDVLITFQSLAVDLEVFRAVERQAQGLCLHDVQRLPLVAGGGNKGVHLVHVDKGVFLLAEEGHVIRKAQAVALVLEHEALVPVADDVQVHVLPELHEALHLLEHDVVALLVAEPPDGHEV